MQNTASDSTSGGSLPPPPRIRIAIAYPWTKDADERTVPARSDPRWRALRDKVRGVVEELTSAAARRHPGRFPLEIGIERLRGSHGRMLLDEIRARVSASDVLVMDLGTEDSQGFNANVLLEAGMALARASHHHPPFLLKPRALPAPSDLAGYLFTDYDPVEETTGSIRLTDDAGFRAALRSVLMSIAVDRGMIGARREPGLETEGEEAAGP